MKTEIKQRKQVWSIEHAEELFTLRGTAEIAQDGTISSLHGQVEDANANYMGSWMAAPDFNVSIQRGADVLMSEVAVAAEEVLKNIENELKNQESENENND